MKKIYFVLILALGCMSYSFSQVTVSGNVVSNTDGIPVPGVSVVLKGQPTKGDHR